MEKVRQVAGNESLLRLLPLQTKKYGLVTTENEVFFNRIQDTFSPVIRKKMEKYGCEMTEHRSLDDNHEKITRAINEMLAAGTGAYLIYSGLFSILLGLLAMGFLAVKKSL